MKWNILLAVALAGQLSRAAFAAGAGRPNVVVILVDDLGFSDFGCYGGEISTPEIDRLAADGACFSQAYNTARCSPTRAALLTGRYPHQVGMGNLDNRTFPGDAGFQGRLADDCATIAELLGDAGYYTAMTGKWHLGQFHGTPPWERGFRRTLNLSAGGLHFSNQRGDKTETNLFLSGQPYAKDDAKFNPPWYGADLWTDWGIRFIDEARAADKPFFLYLAHCAPHFPCMAPKATIAKYRGKYLMGWDELRRRRRERQVASGLVDDRWSLAPRTSNTPAWESLSEDEQDRYDEMMAIYAAMVEEVDRNVGRLVAALRERGQLDDTLVLLLSDNGGNAETGVAGVAEGVPLGGPDSRVLIGQGWAELNNTPFRKYKHFDHEGGIATPLIAHGANFVALPSGDRRWIDEPVHVIDVLATCLDACDVEYPASRNGRPLAPTEGMSLLPLISGSGTIAKRALYFEHEGNAAVREGAWKLVRDGGRGAWELYDMVADRTELHDLASQKPKLVDELAAGWRAWAKRSNVPLNDTRFERRADGTQWNNSATRSVGRKNIKRRRTPRPNVLLVVADDLGYSDLGFMGGEIPTPHLDRLAEGSVRFTQCYNSSRCCPSRASLLTGLYPHQTGIGSFAEAIPRREKGPAYLGHLNRQCVTLGEVLRAAGYQTYMVGKWHLEEPGPTERGFDEFYGFVKGYEQDQWNPARYQRLPAGRTPELTYSPGQFYATDAFADYALEFLNQARSVGKEGQRPWFMYLAHSAPHFPLQAPKESIDKFVAAYRRGWDALRDERFERLQKLGIADESWQLTERSLVPVDDDAVANGYSGRPNPAWSDLPVDRREDLARRMATYAAMVSHVDEGMGRILADLQANGEMDNTLVLFLSDNGACYEWGPFGFDENSRKGVTRLHSEVDLAEMGGPGTYHSYGSGWANLCNTPFRMYKHFTYEGGQCTPLIMHWPAGFAKSSQWIHRPVHVMDVLPTLVQVCNAKYPARYGDHDVAPFEGQSLAPLIRRGSFPERSLGFEHNGARALRRGNWKVVWPVKTSTESRWELYNLQTDRCETHDVASEFPELCKELADEWLAWARRVKVYPIFKPGGTIAALTPMVAQRPITISAEVQLASAAGAGVVLAQGGGQHGYALYVADGKLSFVVRTNGVVHATPPVALGLEKRHVEARLFGGGRMELWLDGRLSATARAAGLLLKQPIDPLSIGEDGDTAVGEYLPPSPLDGHVDDVRINGVRVESPTIDDESPRPDSP